MSTPSIGLLGAKGRMGRYVSELVKTTYSDRAHLSAEVGRGAVFASLLKSDVVIDFSSAEAMTSVAHAALLSHDPLPCFVIGSTGWTADQDEELKNLAKKTPVLRASNFSTGVLALHRILSEAAPLLMKLGYSPVLVETHHRHKKDAPSGTALSLQKTIAPKTPSSVQTHSIRAGEIIGDHEVTFYGAGDHITIGHFAQDRSVFARGAIEVALWLANARAHKQVTEGSILNLNSYLEGVIGK